MMSLGLGWEKEFFVHEEIETVEWSNTTKFVLCRTRSAPARTDKWIVMCERTIQETGVIEQIIIFSADTEFATRKVFRTLRRVTGYVDCDNDIAIPGLF